MRAGAQTLRLLGAPRIFLILQSLAAGPKGQLDLRRDAGSPAQSTLRSHLRALEELGVVECKRQSSFPGAIEYELTAVGRELNDVAASAERWLRDAPGGPLSLGNDPSRAAIKGLADSWSTTVLTTLAARPSTLTELDKQISKVSYPTIERCLQTMRLADQLEVSERSRHGTRYTLTRWVRRGLTPLAVAARWEHRHRPPEAEAVQQSDLDDALQLGEPFLELPDALAGACQLAARPPDGDRHARSLAYVEVHDGKATFGGVYPQRKPDAWASATADGWFDALLDGEAGKLRMSGDTPLLSAVLQGLRHALFPDTEAISPASIPK